jgi:hypothetical protein
VCWSAVRVAPAQRAHSASCIRALLFCRFAANNAISFHYSMHAAQRPAIAAGDQPGRPRVCFGSLPTQNSESSYNKQLSTMWNCTTRSD